MLSVILGERQESLASRCKNLLVARPFETDLLVEALGRIVLDIDRKAQVDAIAIARLRRKVSQQAFADATAAEGWLHIQILDVDSGPAVPSGKLGK